MTMINEDQLRHRHNEELQELHRQLDKKDSILQNYQKEHGKLEVFFRRVLNNIAPISSLPKIHVDTKKSTSEVVPVMQITDSHMGAVQEPNEIEGFNQFSPEICEKRNLGFAKSFIEWVNLHRNVYNIRNCKILVTGDLISGDIHQELLTTNAFPSPEQVVRASQVHAKQIALIAPYFDRVDVEFISEDNHARLTKKPQAKEAGMNSMNYLVGRMMESYLSGHDNIEFNLYPMHEKVVSVLNINYLIMHGHGIRAWMGIPWYGIERRVAKESTARQNIIMNDLQRAKDVGFHKIIHGHFHTPFDGPLYACGGSVSGTDAFDHQNGRYSPPSQSAWMVHKKHGEFNRVNFQLKYFD